MPKNPVVAIATLLIIGALIGRCTAPEPETKYILQCHETIVYHADPEHEIWTASTSSDQEEW